MLSGGIQVFIARPIDRIPAIDPKLDVLDDLYLVRWKMNNGHEVYQLNRRYTSPILRLRMLG